MRLSWVIGVEAAHGLELLEGHDGGEVIVGVAFAGGQLFRGSGDVGGDGLVVRGGIVEETG